MPTSNAPQPGNARASKSAKQSKILRLKLSPSLLSSFPHETVTRKPSQPKTPSSSTSTPVPKTEQASPVDVKSESNTTPAPTGSNSVPPPVDDSKRKTLLAPKPPGKRALGAGVEGPKPRGKPGPKKKPRLDNGLHDGNDGANKSTPGTLAPPSHKLGPKANQGAINAGLRALDRSGKACRRWGKKEFRVKTFTGVTWQIQSWRSPQTKILTDADADQISLPTSNSESKAHNGGSSSNIGSERSNAQDIDSQKAASSPLIPSVAIPA